MRCPVVHFLGVIGTTYACGGWCDSLFEYRTKADSLKGEHTLVARQLIDGGANPHQKLSCGKSPFEHASSDRMLHILSTSRSAESTVDKQTGVQLGLARGALRSSEAEVERLREENATLRKVSAVIICND